MPGKIKAAIEQILVQRSNSNANLIAPLKIKLIMKGIDPDHWHESSPDDAMMLARVQNAAKDMGVSLPAGP